MRFIVTTTIALLTLLVGITLWSLQPTQRVFSWVETSELDFLAGVFPEIDALVPSPENPTAVPFGQYQEALNDLARQVEGPYYPFVSFGTMGNRLHLESGESFPIFNESYVSQRFFEARQVSAQHGRLFNAEEEGVIVLGHRLARTLFGEPSRAVGQDVTISSAIGREAQVTIIGVMSPSPNQEPQLDLDEGVVWALHPNMRAQGFYIFDILPLMINIRFHTYEAMRSLMPELERWAGDYFGSQGRVISVNEFIGSRQATVEETLPRIAARRVTFLIFCGALVISALLALYAQSIWQLLRRRQLLGVEKALGATQQQLTFYLIMSQLPWAFLGGLLGWLGLWSLYDLLPKVFLTRPPWPVLAVAMLAPLVALVILAVAVSLPILTQSAMSLLRGRVKGKRIRPTLWLVYGGLALALAGGLAAYQVFRQVQREADALQGQFGDVYAVQAGNPVIDDRAERAFEAGSDFSPVFTARDAHALRALPGVSEAVVAQTIPNLNVTSGETTLSLRAVAAGPSYLDFMGLGLAAGHGAGCVLTEGKAAELGVGVGSSLTLAGLIGPVNCDVTGILQPPPELWPWLVSDLPDIIAPPLDGLGLPLPGHTAQPFASTRLLARLASPEGAAALEAWREAAFPEVHAEVIPYTPDVETLLSSLRVQAQLFLLTALLAAVLAVWGVVGGFFSLLEAERFRLAVDRALGLSVGKLARAWWLQVSGFGAVSAAFGLSAGYLLADRLYNALALDIPNLPERTFLTLYGEFIAVTALALVLLSTGLTWLAVRWLRRRSPLALLKEGAA